MIDTANDFIYAKIFSIMIMSNECAPFLLLCIFLSLNFIFNIAVFIIKFITFDSYFVNWETKINSAS